MIHEGSVTASAFKQFLEPELQPKSLARTADETDNKLPTLLRYCYERCWRENNIDVSR